MGGISTSHSASLSNHKASASKEFDLRNWRGLTDLLRVGRESIPDPRAYAEFRNLVLGYAQRGGDAELRRNIDAIVATFSDKKTTEVAQETPPSRKIEVHHEVSEIKEEKQVGETDSAKAESSDVIKVSEQVVPPSAPTRASLGIPTRRMPPRFVKPISPSFIPKEVHTPEPEVVNEHVTHVETGESSTHVVPETSEVVAHPHVPKTLEEHKARIAEIKRLVHAEIGNPVALMGAHKNQGKQYMTALLSALKATSGGSIAEIEEKMQILEEETARLLKDVAEGTQDDMQEESSDVKEHMSEEPSFLPHTETPTPEMKEEKTEDVVVESPVRHVPVMPVISIEEEVHKEHESILEVEPVKHEPENSAVVPPKVLREEPIVMKEEGRVPLHKYSVAEMLASKSTHVREEVSVPQYKPVSRAEEREQEHVAEKPKQTTSVLGDDPQHPRTKHIYKAVSVADPEVVKEVIGIDPHVISSEQSELYSPKITEALHQLLHEWTIFGSSGLFGIGPGGAEHPLYIKLSLISMGELLAGRWEKADPKLIKVIKQYVDAWRHEQGIAYTIDETFEHYLRRVVQRIMKRQGN